MPAISLLIREEFLAQLSPLSVSACAAVDSETACVICTGEPVDTPVQETDERAVLLHGRHTFGETCAREWLAHNNTCPKCRTVLFQNDPDSDADETASETDVSDEDGGFDANELEQLIWQAREIEYRDPRTGVFSDTELMTVFLGIWTQWRSAMAQANDDGSWDRYSAASTRVGGALHNLALTRMEWFRANPLRLGINITETFDNSASHWEPSHAELERTVEINFRCRMQSELYHCLMTTFKFAHDEDYVCRTVAGHPVAYRLFQNLDATLEAYAGRRMRVSSLIRRLRANLGHREDIEARRDLPVGYANFVEYVIYATCQMAIRLERERKRARRAQRERARRDSASRQARMSAPSRPQDM
jgi:hypothetical protein